MTLLSNIACQNKIVPIETILNTSKNDLIYKRESSRLIMIYPRNMNDPIPLVTLLQRRKAPILVISWWDENNPPIYGRLTDHHTRLHRPTGDHLDLATLQSIAKKDWGNSAIARCFLNFTLCP